MAQRMIDIYKKENSRDSITQTDTNLNKDFCIHLSKTKFIKAYKSKSYGEYILTINCNKSKKIVLTKSMWKILRKNINQIDGVFMDN